MGNQMGTFSAAFIVAVALLMLVGVFRSMKWRSFLHPIFLILGLVASSLSPFQLVFPKDLVRTLALPLAFLPAMLAGATGEPDPTRTRGRSGERSRGGPELE